MRRRRRDLGVPSPDDPRLPAEARTLLDEAARLSTDPDFEMQHQANRLRVDAFAVACAEAGVTPGTVSPYLLIAWGRAARRHTTPTDDRR